MANTLGSRIAWKRLIEMGLSEDHFQWDWSALAVLQNSKKSSSIQSRATLVAKEFGVWAGDGLVEAMVQVAHEMGEVLTIRCPLKNGDFFKKGQVLLEWRGRSQVLLAFERTVINALAFACGIATATRTYADQLKRSGLQIRIAPTRKTLPGLKDLSIQAVLAGGASPHRFNLSGGVLIKENHIRTAGSITRAIIAARKVAPHGLKIEVEVTNLVELKEAIRSEADIIMLDNFTPVEIKAALKLKPKKGILIEVSGGINDSNFSEYLIPGVDVISIGALTHSVRSLDMSLQFGT